MIKGFSKSDDWHRGKRVAACAVVVKSYGSAGEGMIIQRAVCPAAHTGRRRGRQGEGQSCRFEYAHRCTDKSELRRRIRFRKQAVRVCETRARCRQKERWPAADPLRSSSS